ncbi:hypothetical protein S1OALGB6SA_1346 [Olavius algarvensis spirochete endosymbiont]|nr:hypothetical protein S1OALGB6SA_1346 [Olavius algarvensis spirochete endosymbiont]
MEYKELIVTTYPSSIRQKSLLICVAYLLQARLSVVNPAIPDSKTLGLKIPDRQIQPFVRG